MAVTNLYHTSTPSGTVSAVGAGSILFDNWKEIQGSIWSESSGTLQAASSAAFNTSFLERPTSENRADARTIVTLNPSSSTYTVLVLRRNDPNYYLAVVNLLAGAGASGVTLYYNEAGGVTTIGSSQFFTWTSGHTYTLDFSVEGTSLNITVTDTTASSTPVNYTQTDSHISASGAYALSSGNGVGTNAITQIALYNKDAASDTTPPVFASASIPSNGRTVAVVLTETGSPPVLPATGVTGFTVLVNGAARSVISATSSSTTVTLNLATPALTSDTVTVSYAPGNVSDSATSPNAMLAFSAQPVTNGSTVGQWGVPTALVANPGGWTDELGNTDATHLLAAVQSLDGHYLQTPALVTATPVSITFQLGTPSGGTLRSPQAGTRTLQEGLYKDTALNTIDFTLNLRAHQVGGGGALVQSFNKDGSGGATAVAALGNVGSTDAEEDATETGNPTDWTSLDLEIVAVQSA